MTESWLTIDHKDIEKLYNWLETVLYEVKKKRRCLLESKIQNIYLDELFHFIHELCRRENIPEFRLLSRCLEEELRDFSLDKTK